MQKAARLKRELKQLSEAPSKGISCWPIGDKTDQLEASIVGQEDTPYSGGIFKLSIAIPDRYPFEPPQVRFVTPIYHPNIDTAGRICLDILKMPPKGAWKPAHNISTLLKSIQILLSDPNPDDPLMAEISSELKCNKALFTDKAKQWTQKFANESQPLIGDGGPESHESTEENSNKRHCATYPSQDVGGTKKSKIGEL